MSVLAMTCPHCGVENVAFNAVCESFADAPVPNLVTLRCAKCGHGVLAETFTEPPVRRDGIRGFASVDGDFSRLAPYARIFPKPAAPFVPPHVPNNVRDLFAEGAHCVKQAPNSACMVFRSCLEALLRHLAPEIDGKVSLWERIDRLAAEHKLPPAIQDWAHYIRGKANKVVHPEQLATKNDARELESFTYYALLYLCTLPEEIKLARTRKDEQPAQG